uniref:Uncharacterized protein n=2 Tax=Moniliophthora roreri TaxID=221103 RepID=A0A0W0FB14_MONRR
MTRESMSGNRDNHFFHVLRRSTPKSMLKHLEPKWGKGIGTLNVDSSGNIGVIQANHHKAFDSGAFMFFPTVEVIEEIMVYALAPGTKDLFDQKFDNEFWIYSFVPLSFNADRSIFIKNTDENLPGSAEDKFANALGYTECPYPYDHPVLRAIESHIHPFYAIFNAGQKIAALGDMERAKLYQREPSALLVFKIYDVWTAEYISQKPNEQRDRHNKADANDGISPKDQGDLPNPIDVHDDLDSSVGGAAEAKEKGKLLPGIMEEVSDVSDGEDTEASDGEEDDTKDYDSSLNGENATVFGAPPAFTITDTTATGHHGQDDPANQDHDFFGPRHHATSKSAVTAPAAFKLSGTKDSNTRLSNRFGGPKSTHESPLRSKSLTGRSHSLLDLSQRPSIVSEPRNGKQPGMSYDSSLEVHQRLKIPRRPGVHPHKSYGPNQKLLQSSSTGLASRKGSAVHHYNDVGTLPHPGYMSKDLIAKRSYRLDELASIHRKQSEENMRRERARNPHYPISEPASHRQNAERERSTSSFQSSSAPNLEMPPPPVPTRSSSSSGSSNIPLVAQSDPRNATLGSSTRSSRSALPQLSIETGTSRSRSDDTSSSESPTKKRKPYSSPPPK